MFKRMFFVLLLALLLRSINSYANFRICDTIITESQEGISVRFNWEPADGALKYQLAVSTDPQFKLLSWREFTVDNSAVVKTLKPDTTYYWKVAAILHKGKNLVNTNGVKSFRTPALTITKPTITVPRGSAIIDGKIDPNEWKTAVSISLNNFPIGSKDELEQLPQGKLMWDDDSLYVAFKIWFAKGSKVHTEQVPRDSMIHAFDSLEMFLYGPGRSKGYHFILNASDSVYDDYGGDTEFNGDWRHAVDVKDKFWTLEIAIPFSVVRETPSIGSQWKAEFHANLKTQSVVPTWSGKTTPFGRVETFGTLVLGKDQNLN